MKLQTPVQLSKKLSSVHLHLVTALFRQVMNGDKVSNILLPNNLFVEDGRGPLGEGVALELLGALVGLDVVALQRGLLGGDDGDVHVASRSQVIPDAGLDGVGAELDGLVLGELGLPLRLEHRHGGQGARAHRHVG